MVDYDYYYEKISLENCCDYYGVRMAVDGVRKVWSPSLVMVSNLMVIDGYFGGENGAAAVDHCCYDVVVGGEEMVAAGGAAAVPGMERLWPIHYQWT